MSRLWRPDPDIHRTLGMESMQRLYRAASAQGFGIKTSRSSISPKRYLCEITEHKPHKDTHLSFSRGAVYGDTPLIAEVAALVSVGVVFDYAAIGLELLEEAMVLTTSVSRAVPQYETAIEDLLETLRARP